jgi:hypothetical protein
MHEPATVKYLQHLGVWGVRYKVPGRWGSGLGLYAVRNILVQNGLVPRFCLIYA